MPVGLLRQNLSRAAAALQDTLSGLAEQLGPLRLDEVQIGLEVSASGGITLIGAGWVKAAVTLVLRAATEPTSERFPRPAA